MPTVIYLTAQIPSQLRNVKCPLCGEEKEVNDCDESETNAYVGRREPTRNWMLFSTECATSSDTIGEYAVQYVLQYVNE